MKATRPLLLLCVVPLLAACTQFPEVDKALEASDSNAPYPKLAPLTGDEGSEESAVIDDDLIETLDDRTKALKRRAKWLKRQKI